MRNMSYMGASGGCMGAGANEDCIGASGCCMRASGGNIVTNTSAVVAA